MIHNKTCEHRNVSTAHFEPPLETGGSVSPIDQNPQAYTSHYLTGV
jgi:hypothetical protein